MVYMCDYDLLHAGEVNHVHGAHKAASFAMAHALHDLGQPSPVPTPDGEVLQISDTSGMWWADRMRAEVIRVAGDGPPSREDLMQGRLPITRAIILEATRKHSVSLGVVRQTGAELPIDGVVMPSGTEVLILLEAIHTMPCFWMRAHEFRPERWIAKNILLTALQHEGCVVGADGLVEVDGRHVDIGGPIVGSALPALDAGSKDAAGTSVNAVAAEDDASSGTVGYGTHGKVARTSLIPRSRQEMENPISPPAFSFVPFLTGSRMCAGKVLAETEVLIILSAIVRVCRVRTHTTYVGHINQRPFCAGPAVAQSIRSTWPDGVVDSGGVITCASMDGDTSGEVRVHPNYDGPADILLKDSMYSSIDGLVPFSASPL
jgi:hypothetical protein